jgi:hypothetical protein
MEKKGSVTFAIGKYDVLEAKCDRYKKALEDILRYYELYPDGTYVGINLAAIAEKALKHEKSSSQQEEVNLTAGDPDFGAGEE